MSRRRLLSLAAAGLLATVAPRAGAVVTNTNEPGASGRNTTAPVLGSNAYAGWNLQGDWGKWLGTPIGPNHFITAIHPDPAGNYRDSDFTFRGVEYTIDQSYGNGGFVDVPGSDLRIYKVNGTLPAYAQIHTEKAELQQAATIFGRGRQRGAAQTAPGKPQPGGHAWGAFDNAEGSGVMSWGENRVIALETNSSVGDVLRFNFDGPGHINAIPNEAHISEGDSGGAVFVQDNGVWELAGINYAADAGPFAYSNTGAGAFNGTLYDASSFYRYNGTSWVLQSQIPVKPTFFLSSRISTRAEYIYAATQSISIVQQNWAVPGNYVVADVSVAGTLTVGDAAQPSKATSLTANHVRGGTFQVRDNATVTFRRNGGAGGVSKVADVVVGALGAIDLADNALIQQSDGVAQTDELAELVALVKKGRNNGAWDGKGITSGEARADSLRGLAVIRNNNDFGGVLFSSYKGQGLALDDVIVAYALNGDSDLDGEITADDYARIDKGYLSQNGNPTKFRTYRWGDLNYDGVINASDYALIDAAFLAQNPGATSTPSGVMTTVLPEPGGLVAVALAGVALSLRRRRVR